MISRTSTSPARNSQQTIRLLQAELAETSREVMALTLELEKRVDERTAQLSAAQEELGRTNSGLLQLTLELEDRVAERTEELARANASLRAEIARRHAVEAEIRALNAELEGRVKARTAELAAANTELESFVYAVSHDLRAPLRGIDGWSMALLEDYAERLDDQGRQYLNTVRSETQRMGQLIDALLRLSRATRSEMHRERLDMTQMVRQLEQELRQEEPDRPVECVVAPDVTAPADPTLLRAALRNLLGNAWKFTSQREHARIEFGMILREGNATFFVRDNGAGFDMAYAGKLFTPFQRLHRNDEFPGTGVGLATVQRIIHRHGGRIWAEAEVDKGATFFFTL